MVGLLRPANKLLFMAGLPPISAKMSQNGVRTRVRTHFFRCVARRGPTRERMVRSTPPPRSGAEENFFTPKAYLHTSFCVQKMGDPELSFRLHRVLFCVRHFGTNASLASPRASSVLNPVKKLPGRGRSPPSDLAASRLPGSDVLSGGWEHFALRLLIDF